ncbi:Ketohexokinase [Drechslerella dactyloides]|uniref:Ketohexokinase n=1 Tax=Drechslerella dactyloides TaxID=74499 RepID=A0AAD6NKN7_DREDA|nr:Ketohexokinase [Drechslerella dactyloides]
MDSNRASNESSGFSLLALGALYRDIIIKVPSFPAEDAKQSAVSEQVRVGGNVSNTLSVLSQVVAPGTQLLYATVVGGPEGIWRPLIAALEVKGITVLYEVREGENEVTPTAYIFESQSTGSRTIISHQLIRPLRSPEVKTLLFTHFLPKSALFETHAYDEMLLHVWSGQSDFFPSWLHFEGRECFTAEGVIDDFISRPEYKVTPCAISVELEMFGRPGLDRLARMADVLFVAEGYAREYLEDVTKRSWKSAEKAQLAQTFASCFKAGAKRGAVALMTVGAAGAYVFGFRKDAEVLHIPAPSVPATEIVETTGAGDTFIGAAIYAMGYKRYDAVKAARIAVNVATAKCMQVGYDKLGTVDGGFGKLETTDDPLDGVISARSSVGPDVRRMEELL